ncbi:ATP-dependent zinc metalloprotease FtsH [Flavobacteriales bacterium]|nr:ATP-dependent zinc metalloprotease FtsH [Flavobacteriales bacterium]
MANNKKPAPNKKNVKPGMPKFNFYWIYGIAIAAIIGFSLFGNAPTGNREINFGKFQEMAEKGHVEKITYVKNTGLAEVTLKREAIENNEDYTKFRSQTIFNKSRVHYTFDAPPNEEFYKELKEINDKLSLENQFTIAFGMQEDYSWLTSLLFFVGIIALWFFIMRRMSGGGAGGGGGGGQIFNIGKSKAKLFEKGKSVDVSFKDVAGLEGAKEEVQEIVDFLKNPKKYTTLGAKIPKGALLVGLPGTGKTLLAKAVAGEAKVPFFSMSGSDFVEMFVGVGASRVRDLFKQAKEKAPCIIFIDEIDAIGKARGNNPNMGSNDERENTLNQLLTEMDGFGTNSGVIILAATNRADILDKALMRAGRFDRQIHVDMPDLNERREIFEVHLKPLKLEKGFDVEFIAKQTPGFSGADIANLCNEAALIAARKKKDVVEKQDFLDAVDRLIGGLEKKNKLITQSEKEKIAYHEAGHATVSWLTKYASPLIKVTIVPRGKSLGAAWYLPEERQLTTTNHMLDEMCATMGGRAAEKVIFGEISTGALSDLEKATKQAYAMVSVYGLNEKLGNISFYNSQDNGFTKPYSESTAQIIDEEVSKMIEIQYERAQKILTENKDKLTEIAQLLLEKEVIFKEDLVKVLGERPFKKEEPLASLEKKEKEENKEEE